MCGIWKTSLNRIIREKDLTFNFIRIEKGELEDKCWLLDYAKENGITEACAKCRDNKKYARSCSIWEMFAYNFSHIK